MYTHLTHRMYQLALVTYRLSASDEWRGAVRQEFRLIDFEALGFAGTMRQLLASGRSAVDRVIRLAEDANAWREIDNDVVFGQPVPDPDKILCIGLNYREHARESGLEVPSVPIVFAKFRNSLIGPGSAIELPAISQQIDYEGELAVVIGERCKNVPMAETLSVVAGYSILNDVSARDLQLEVSQWTVGKAIDTFAPMGPGIVPAQLVPDPQQLNLITRVNGQVVQRSSTWGALQSSGSAFIGLVKKLLSYVFPTDLSDQQGAGLCFPRGHRSRIGNRNRRTSTRVTSSAF